MELNKVATNKITFSSSNRRQHRKSLPHDYKSMVATLPPIPGQVPSATGERRKIGKTIDERSYPDEDSEETGMEFNSVGGEIKLPLFSIV